MPPFRLRARWLGYDSFEPANSTYGRLAKKVGEVLGIDGYDIGADTKRHWPILAVGMRGSPFRWFLREEVDEALQKLEWFQSASLPEETGTEQSNGPLPDGKLGPAERTKTVISWIARDTQLSRRVKALHDYVCQVCETTLEISEEERYAEAHHIKPLGSPHDGPDIAANILCVCPNCHVLLDKGARPIDPEGLRRVSEHRVGSDYVAYHNDQIVGD